MDRDFQEIINRLNRKLGEAKKFREKMAKRIKQMDQELKQLKNQRPSQKSEKKTRP